jgi:hypothetical protein
MVAIEHCRNIIKRFTVGIFSLSSYLGTFKGTWQ